MRARDFLTLDSTLLNEVKMSPVYLKQLAKGIDAEAGMEFEMIVPNVSGSAGESEPNYDEDRRTDSIDDVLDFFDDGNWNGAREITRLKNTLTDEYSEWLWDRVSEAWSEEGEQYLRDYIEQNDWDETAEIENYLSDNMGLSDEEVQAAMKAGSRKPYDTSKEVNQAREEDSAFDNYMAASDAMQEVFDDRAQDEWENNSGSYDNAYREFSSEKESDISDSDWLSDTYPYMSDIESSFGITWPHWTEGGDLENDLENVAESFREAIRYPVMTSTQYHGASRQPGAYSLEPDTSLNPGNSNDAGLEFISPPTSVDTMLTDLNKVVQWAKRYGCYTNESTGLHMNVSIPDFNIDKLDYIKLALLMGDEHILEAFKRLGNTYCKPAMVKARNSLAGASPEQVVKYLQQVRKGLAFETSKAIHSGITDKYTSINTKDGYVEFRSPGNDWLNMDIPKLENTLLRFVVALDAACDPEKFKQDYYKKLYKFLAPKSDNDPIAYFAKFSAGVLAKEHLALFIRELQRHRIKKSSDPQMSFDFTKPATTSGEWTGRWLVLDNQGRQIYRLGGIGNNQGDANRVASNWAREAGIRGEISVVPEMSGHTDEEFNTWEIRSDDGEVLDTLSI